MAPTITTIIGRGHSGTRLPAQTLEASGVYMGSNHNGSDDLMPPEDLYEAARIVGRLVVHLGGNRWDFAPVLDAPVDPAFVRLVESYLADVLASESAHVGWKLPETVLTYPWLTRVFPEARFIHWVRDPRDCVLDRHITDDLAEWDVAWEPTGDVHVDRATSWRYQRAIVRATPPPRHAIQVRFEDFVLDQEATLARLGAFVGLPLATVAVRPDAVARWRRSPEVAEALQEHVADELDDLGYERTTS